MAPRTGKKAADTATAEAPADAPQVDPKALARMADMLTPPEQVEPEAGDPAGDNIEFVRTGVIRILAAGNRYRLRRPFFGELRRLRTAWQDYDYEVQDRSDEARDLSKRIKADIEAMSPDDPERTKKLRALRDESRAAGREHEEFVENGFLAWWVQVFELLTMGDGTPGPDETPGWLIDHTLVAKVFAHWRSVPLGHGSPKLNGSNGTS